MGTLRVRSRRGAPWGVQGAFLPRARRPTGLTGGPMGLHGLQWTCAILFLTLTWGAQASAGEHHQSQHFDSTTITIQTPSPSPSNLMHAFCGRT